MNKDKGKIICFQIGAREHYALPRGFHQQGRLAAMVTDFLYPDLPGVLKPIINGPTFKALQLRDHPDLGKMPAVSFATKALLFELGAKLKKQQGWDLIMARNQWFERMAAAWLEDYLRKANHQPVVFSYSYAALEIFKVARKYGCTTVLGQIDGAMAEEDIVRKESELFPEFKEGFATIPSAYWDHWRQEVHLAHYVVINSAWSKNLALKNGVSENKLLVAPLAYESGKAETSKGIRKNGFQTPLKVLYLGTLTLRKGLARLLNVAKLLEGFPIEFTIAGGSSVVVPDRFKNLSNVKFTGKIERDLTNELYREHHVFIFPTLSDGFGMTQLEALSNGCYLVVSPYCGEVVDSPGNGIVVDPYDAEKMAETLRKLATNESRVWHLPDSDMVSDRFSINNVCSLYP